MWKKIRVTVLSVVLVCVACNAYQDTNHKWDSETKIVLHPINADHSIITQTYISSLTQKDFDEITEYIQNYAQQYRGVPTSIKYELVNELYKKPPLINENEANDLLSVILWSLKFRLYSLMNFSRENIGSSVVVYLNYFDTKNYKENLPRSTALERGRIALVNLSISQPKTNNMIILHESLHSLGAKDHYDLFTGNPIYPNGYAEPDKNPLYPQEKAELMGGYIPINQNEFTIPKSLNDVVVNQQTAIDLKWIPDTKK